MFSCRDLLAAAILLTAMLSPAGSAHASFVNWGVATNISGDSDVSTTGMLVGAFNLGDTGPGDTGVADTTVNGVTFTGLVIPNGSKSVTSGNFTLAIADSFLSSNDFGSLSAPFSSLTAPYQALLSSAAGDSATPFTLTMGGLTPGAAYEFEWWSNGSQNAFSDILTTASATNDVTLNLNTSASVGGVGQFAVGNFVADASPQVITFSSNDSDVVNGFQLRVIPAPEPATWAWGLATTAIAASALYRRKRAKALHAL